MAASTDHLYTKISTLTEKNERTHSIFHGDHEYSRGPLESSESATQTPTRKKCGRRLSTPTGKTPCQPSKKQSFDNKGQRNNQGWSVEEKDFLTTYVGCTPRLGIHATAQCSQPKEHDDVRTVGTQTDSIMSGPSREVGDPIFFEPKEDLKEGASKSSQYLHKTAVKCLRQYAPLTNAEKSYLIDAISNGTLGQIARAVLGTMSLGEEVKKLLIFDTEMEARECANKGSALYFKNYHSLMHFKWENVIAELTGKQQFLAELLMAISFPRDRIGNTKETEALIPVIGMTYSMLMKQRYYALNGTQKMLSIALANEQTHQKVYDRLQPLGITLSHQGMLDAMTSISGRFNDRLIDSLKHGNRFRIVGDNINFHTGIAKERKSAGLVRQPLSKVYLSKDCATMGL